MNLPTLSVDDAIVIGNIFDTGNDLLSQATTFIQALVVFLGLLAFVAGSAAGRWKTAPVIMAAVAAALIIWFGISGVPWLADPIDSTVA